jgi:hypothetical protein
MLEKLFNFEYLPESNWLTLNNDSRTLVQIELKLPCKLSIEEIIYRLCFEFEDIDQSEYSIVPSTPTNYQPFKLKIDGTEKLLIKHYLTCSSDIKQDLFSFLKSLNQNYYDAIAKSALNSFKTGLFTKNDLKDYWQTLNSRGHLSTNEAYSKLEERDLTQNGFDQNSQKMSYTLSSASPIFSKMYQTLLIHSHQLMGIILKRERCFMIEFKNLIIERDKHLRMIKETSSSNGNDSESINLEKSKWKLRIDDLKSIQQRKFRKFITKLYQCKESELLNINLETFNAKVKEIENDLDMDAEINDYVVAAIAKTPAKETKIIANTKKFTSSSSSMSSLRRIEESYTIQLGAQLKTTHNLRLIRCDILEFCKDRFKSDVEVTSSAANNDNDIMDLIEPQSILTAMSLYTENLCGLVLLVDKLMSKNLENILDNNGCDFHFFSVDQQIENILSQSSMKCPLNIGDFYLTKHSNLSQCHVLFHLMINEKLELEKMMPRQTLKHSDLSSRHPIIMGLRNVLKSCINHNIQTLTFPLLLTHEMTDEMTISWVMKRAELVLKCIKGFMIEFVQWGAQESRTLQFVVPQGLMDETFNLLSNLIKTIFRESRTVNLN